MKIRWKSLLVCIALPLAVGALAAFLTREGMERFGALNQPPLSPPDWLFPVVWTILYTLMGIASYQVYHADAPDAVRKRALWCYGVQLLFNFLWSIFFFELGLYYFAFFWLLVLWGLIFLTIVLFNRAKKGAGWLLLPYIVWVSFALYLNIGVALLN